MMTDLELIDYTIKFDTDPVRVRLAKYMDSNPAQVLLDLEKVGMNSETLLFENTHYPDEYITHLENEIEYLNRELSAAQEQLAERETLTVSELINELRDIAMGANRRAEMYIDDRDRAYKQRDEMKHKLDMWAILNR